MFLHFKFHIVAINHHKSIKSIDINLYKKITNAKSKQNYKLSTLYTSENEWVWPYCNNNDIVTSQTGRRIVSTTVVQVMAVMNAVRTWRRYNLDMTLIWCRHGILTSYQCLIDVACLLKILLTKLFWKLTILSVAATITAIL